MTLQELIEALSKIAATTGALLNREVLSVSDEGVFGIEVRVTDDAVEINPTGSTRW